MLIIFISCAYIISSQADSKQLLCLIFNGNSMNTFNLKINDSFIFAVFEIFRMNNWEKMKAKET